MLKDVKLKGELEARAEAFLKGADEYASAVVSELDRLEKALANKKLQKALATPDEQPAA